MERMFELDVARAYGGEQRQPAYLITSADKPEMSPNYFCLWSVLSPTKKWDNERVGENINHEQNPQVNRQPPFIIS
jgi:hypothetical protein